MFQVPTEAVVPWLSPRRMSPAVVLRAPPVWVTVPLQNTDGNDAHVSASVMVPQPVSSWMAACVPQTLPVQMASERVPWHVASSMHTEAER